MSDNLVKRGGTWYARVQVDGRDIRRSLRTASKAEAMRRLAKVLADAEHLRFHGENRHSWQTIVVDWAQDAAQTIKPSTLRRYLTSLRQLDGILSELYIDQITAATIGRIARRAGVSNATRRRDITAVSMVLRWCSAQGYREDNPTRVWDRGVIKERRDPIRLPEDYDIDCVVAAAPGNFARMILFARYTPCARRRLRASSDTR